MTLAARCSHCQTVFRITGPQLAAAQGWVRCGHCSQVFDAASNLVTPEGRPLDVPTVDAVAPDQPAPVAHPMHPTPAAHQAPAFSAPEQPTAAMQALPDIDLELPDLGPLKAEAARHAEEPRSSAPAAAPPLEGAPSQRDEREPFWDEPAAATTPAHTLPEPAMGATEPTPAPRTAAPDLRGPLAQTAPPSESADSPHGRKAPAAAPPVAAAPGTSPHVVAPWLTVMALTLSLLALSAHALRAHIAQAWPEARPLVLQWCEAVGCSLTPLRLIEAVALQGSTLSFDDDEDVHRLRLMLRHQGDWPVVTPAFDLSILDAQGQVLTRRMIDPVEFENPTAVLEGGSETTLVLAMKLRDIPPGTIGSFKVTPYYP